MTGEERTLTKSNQITGEKDSPNVQDGVKSKDKYKKQLKNLLQHGEIVREYSTISRYCKET